MGTPHIKRLNRTAVLMLFGTAVVIGLIASGVFDPSPFGQRLWQEDLFQMRVAPNSRQINWLDIDIPSTPFTARLTAAYEQGEADAAFGLILGDDDHYLTIAVSPLGYLAVWETTNNDSYYLNWQTWPHVKRGNENNEIWLDVEGDLARVRINREWLWEGSIDLSTDRIGILGESFGGESFINFETIEMFAESGE